MRDFQLFTSKAVKALFSTTWNFFDQQYLDSYVLKSIGKSGNAANYMKGEKLYRKMPLKIPRLKKDLPAQSDNLVKGLQY
jgi:hypothetical protein